MGLFSGIRAIRTMAKIKSGGKGALSLADISMLIISLQDARRNLLKDEFKAVELLFQCLQKCHSKMELDLAAYYEQAAVIIGLFNQIAPYEKYSGMEKTEALFFMNDIRPILEELNPKSEALLNSIIATNPELSKYLLSKEADPEFMLLDLVNRHRTADDDDYINYLMQNCHFLKKEHATAFYGILIVNHLYGKEKALNIMDKLFMKWINLETIDNTSKPIEERIYNNPQNYIPFFCGVLLPNGVVTKEESDQLSRIYTDLCEKHTAKLYQELYKTRSSTL